MYNIGRNVRSVTFVETAKNPIIFIPVFIRTSRLRTEVSTVDVHTLLST